MLADQFCSRSCWTVLMEANRQTIPYVSPSSLTSQVPTLWQAFGLIALYFALQLTIGGLISLTAGLLAVLQHGGDVKEVITQGRHWLAHSDSSAIAVIVTLLASAALIFRQAHRWWPALWSQSELPGFGFTPSKPVAIYLVAIVLGIMMPFVGGLLTQWLAQGHQVSQDIKQLGANASLLVRLPLALLVVSVGPMVEELLFRGVLLSAVARHVGHGWAVALTALLFACVHLPDLGFLWYALPNLALLGLILGWLRVQSGSIWPSVIAHGMNNLLAVVSWFMASH
jgi:membrane protease YdiL (CAAX protease family)